MTGEVLSTQSMDPAKVALFVEKVAGGADPVTAAGEAGFSHPYGASQSLLRQVEVRKALVAATDARLLSEIAPLALDVIAKILRDDAAPASVKGKLALGALDRAAKVAVDPSKREKPLEEMTPAELAELVAKLDPATRAINITPQNAPSRAK